MSQRIHLGISTCPNDTFTFHALMNGNVDTRGLSFDIELLDIQQLNDRLFAGDFDVAKTSFHAALLLSDDAVVLPSGSALGFGVGPLLLSAAPDNVPSRMSQTTLCPGEHTTAALLFQLFYPSTTSIRNVVFSDIMPMLKEQQADFGVCIHEGRFTWQNEGLGLVEDLGTRWEAETDSPLPLGGIIARRSLGEELISVVQAIVHESLQFALRNRSAPLPTMRKHAQEFDDAVLMQHVDLYVNDWTVDLGERGQTALQELCKRAKQCRVIPDLSRDLEVFSSR